MRYTRLWLTSWPSRRDNTYMLRYRSARVVAMSFYSSPGGATSILLRRFTIKMSHARRSLIALSLSQIGKAWRRPETGACARLEPERDGTTSPSGR
jgi:hypothetical protein